MNERRVFIVDDDAAVRDSLSLLLETAGYRVTCFESGEAFLAARPDASIGCVVLDLRMNGLTGLDVQSRLAASGVHLPIIFLTAHGDIPTTVRAIKAGAVDFLTKPVDATLLIDRIDAALVLQQEALAQAAIEAADRARLERLTVREQEVLRLAIQGHPNKEIARLLGISHRTVEFHRSRVLEKTGCNSLLELAGIAALIGASDHPSPP